MTLAKETNLGTITISNLLFAQLIAECFKLESCKNKVWPATKKGRQIGTDMKFNLSDFASAIEVEETGEDGCMDITFSVIIKFGTSIGAVCEALANGLADNVQQKHGKRPNQIKIHVVGVKSKQIAKRNLEVIKNYGTEE